MTRAPALPPQDRWLDLVGRALAEDIGPGDVTSALTISAHAAGQARIEAREAMVVCGLPVAEAVFAQFDPLVRFESEQRDGDTVEAGSGLARLSGPLRGILAGERTALNFLGRLCGIASLTRRYVEAVAGSETAIVDTRKTLPGWRALDKYAVAAGGGVNHRFGLYDGILLKDNHLAAAGGVVPAVKAALAGAPAGLRVQVEVEDGDQAEAACDAGADFLLLDNMTPQETERVVERLAGRALLESSGGVTLENVAQYARAGVQRISIGALTHSVPAADVALEVVPGGVGG